jgi:hypothetical protein
VLPNRYPDIRRVVKGLLENYKVHETSRIRPSERCADMLLHCLWQLRENLTTASSLLTGDSKKEAELRAKAAVESLFLILEYFPAPLDKATGNPLPAAASLRPETIVFTVKALEATKKELESYVSFFPSVPTSGS